MGEQPVLPWLVKFIESVYSETTGKLMYDRPRYVVVLTRTFNDASSLAIDHAIEKLNNATIESISLVECEYTITE